MTDQNPTGSQFEDEVRNIARNLYSNATGQGSQIIDGRERDGVFFNGDVYTVVEATTWKTKEKTEYDGKKTHDLVTKLRQEGKLARGVLITLHEPTPDQKNLIRSKKWERTTKIISFDEFRSQLFDVLSYINNRQKKRFGSVYDHVDHNYEVPLADFVKPTLTRLKSGEIVDFEDVLNKVKGGGRSVIIAEYGVGKSMMLRQIFQDLVLSVRSKRHFRTPIAINLREHLGQSDPIELLERHARANAANPQSLVAAWNAGYVDLLIDGFDELSTRGWTGDAKRLREYRRSSHAVVRKLIKETPKKCGIIIAGRDAYFDSIPELREALHVPETQFSIFRVHPFDEAQAIEFLRKKGFNESLPEWIPTRPLLLTYLVTKGLLKSAVKADAAGNYPRGAAWISLLDMIAERESEQSEGIDKQSLIQFFGALAIQARHLSDGQASFSPQVMERIFFEVNGTTIVDDERNLLLRLPGLGAAQDNAINRSFIDSDFMNACCAPPTQAFVQDPYSDYSKMYNFEALSAPMGEIGVEGLTTLLERAGVPCGVVDAAIQRALEIDASQLAFDLFRSFQKACRAAKVVTFEGIEIDEIDLSGSEFDGVRVEFIGCLINFLLLPTPEETNEGILFKECLIGRLDGRVSREDLAKSQFIDCEVAEYTDEYNVNNQVLDSSLPLGVRVLVVTLRKLFTQYGSSRLESALYRGLDHRSKMQVPRVIELLMKFGFIVPSGRKGKITYAGTKAKRSEALKIIQSPNSANSDIVKECASLS